MRYSEIKKRLKILKKWEYQKEKNFPSYYRIFRLNNWYFRQSINAYDILHSNLDFEDWMNYLYEKNSALLLRKWLEIETPRK
jgi:hypothetical protein